MMMTTSTKPTTAIKDVATALDTHDPNGGIMDFKVLSRYDDLFTDVFLDNLFLWFDTIKMNHDHRRPRVPNQKILAIIQRHILENGKMNDAVNELLQMDYFRHYLAMKSPKQRQEFIQHMKRYLYMYMPNAGYEIGDTRRYCMSSGGDSETGKSISGRRVEACVIATKEWHTGDEMRLLTGMIACLDEDSDAELRKRNRDFSVMWSTRKNCSCLFLGPARFANHDCDSNCKFIAMGQNVITFKVLKDIQLGEEITVYYGNHYFGENNCECKCKTCENLGMGYFAASAETSSTTSSSKENTPIDEENNNGATRRSTRKRKSALYEDYIQHLQSPRRATKRLSTHKDYSLEELIGDRESESGSAGAAESPTPTPTPTVLPIIKKEQQLKHVSPLSPSPLPKQASSTEESFMPISPTTATTARLKVMSIDFLCGSGNNSDALPSPTNKMMMVDNLSTTSYPSSTQQQRRPSDCPMLDLLVDAAMDAGYIRTELKNGSSSSSSSKGMSASSLSPTESIKADSGVSFLSSCSASPANAATTIKKEEPYWSPSTPTPTPALTTTAVKKEKDETGEEMDLDALGDILDDVSDLSSVSSTELLFSATEEDDEEENDDDEESEEDARTGNVNTRRKKVRSAAVSDSKKEEDLMCIACEKPLRRQDISQQVGADMSITNELATWTWSPSAIFTDWRPKRCPRCERHFTIFGQEWPQRKMKKKKKKKATGSRKTSPVVPAQKESTHKKKTSTKVSTPATDTGVKPKKKPQKNTITATKKRAVLAAANTSSSSLGKKSMTPIKTTTSPKMTTTTTTTITTTNTTNTTGAHLPATHQLALAHEEAEGLPPVIYQIQDDPNDLNYIPPSPLSEFEDDF